MAIYTAFAESLRKRASFIDKFEMLAGAPGGALAKVEHLLRDERIDEWILNKNDPEICQILNSGSNRHLAKLIDQTQNWGLALSERLIQRPAFFGEILNTRLLDSDPHISGLTIAISFEGGEFVYKPRPVKLDWQYNKFINFLRHLGGVYLPRDLQILDYNEYGYIEYVKPRPQPVLLSQDEIKTIGSILSIAYLLSGSDFHYENIVFSTEGSAVLIDLECLLQPAFESEFQTYNNPISVLETGILPLRIVSGTEFDFDPSIIGFKAYEFGSSFSDSALLIQEGFNQAYKIILDNKQKIIDCGIISDFFPGKPRYVACNTIDYYRGISRYIYQSTSGLGQEFLSTFRSSNPSWSSLLDSEKEAVAELCVPIFYIDGEKKLLVTERGAATEVKLSRSGTEKALARLSGYMSPDDLNRQLWFIALSFELNAELRGKHFDDIGLEYLRISSDFDSMFESAEQEFHLFECYLKLVEGGEPALIFPFSSDGGWLLQTRGLLESEKTIYQELLAYFNKNERIEISRDRLILLINTMREMSSVVIPSHRSIADSENFVISAQTGPCSELFDLFLGHDDVPPESILKFTERFNYAARHKKFLFLGAIRTRCLPFEGGLICLILALLAAACSARDSSNLCRKAFS